MEMESYSRNRIKALASPLHGVDDRCRLLSWVQVISCRGMELQRSQARTCWPMAVTMKPALPHHCVSRHQQTLSTAYFYLPVISVIQEKGAGEFR